jgi:hypothetical protein
VEQHPGLVDEKKKRKTKGQVAAEKAELAAAKEAKQQGKKDAIKQIAAFEDQMAVNDANDATPRAPRQPVKRPLPRARTGARAKIQVTEDNGTTGELTDAAPSDASYQEESSPLDDLTATSEAEEFEPPVKKAKVVKEKKPKAALRETINAEREGYKGKDNARAEKP